MTTLRKIKRTEAKELREQIAATQGFKCPLCNISLLQLPRKDWCLDHDHSTGAVRGVLCRNCNGIEGKVFNRIKRAARGAPVINWLARLYHYYAHHKINRTGLVHWTYLTPAEKQAKALAKRRTTCLKAPPKRRKRSG